MNGEPVGLTGWIVESWEQKHESITPCRWRGRASRRAGRRSGTPIPNQTICGGYCVFVTYIQPMADKRVQMHGRQYFKHKSRTERTSNGLDRYTGRCATKHAQPPAVVHRHHRIRINNDHHRRHKAQHHRYRIRLPHRCTHHHGVCRRYVGDYGVDAIGCTAESRAPANR